VSSWQKISGPPEEGPVATRQQKMVILNDSPPLKQNFFNRHCKELGFEKIKISLSHKKYKSTQ
jgi:hypothetical protein